VRKRKPVTYERLVKARATLATIIETHGDRYWPLFERLDEECAQYEKRNERLATAKKIAEAHQSHA